MSHSNRNKKPSLEWALGLDEQSKEMILANIVDAPLQTQQLRKILLSKLEGLEKKEMDDTVYLEAGYPTWQAFINGKRAALLSLLELTSFLES